MDFICIISYIFQTSFLCVQCKIIGGNFQKKVRFGGFGGKKEGFIVEVEEAEKSEEFLWKYYFYCLVDVFLLLLLVIYNREYTKVYESILNVVLSRVYFITTFILSCINLVIWLNIDWYYSIKHSTNYSNPKKKIYTCSSSLWGEGGEKGTLKKTDYTRCSHKTNRTGRNRTLTWRFFFQFPLRHWIWNVKSIKHNIKKKS